MFHRESSAFFCREERRARELHEESLRAQMAHEEAAQLRSLKETDWIYSSLEKMLMGWMLGKTILNHPQKYQRWQKPSTYKFYPLYSSIPSGDAA